MSDKLSDKQILKLAEKHHALHPGVDEWWEFRDRKDLLAFARELLAASPAPAIPVLSKKEFMAWVSTQDFGVSLYEAYLHGTKAAPAISESEDTKRLDFLAAESADLVSFAIPYEDDADIGWRVLSHHMREPMPRVIGEVFRDDPRAAIDAARKGDKS
ncbi:hypothetical protein [Burkholderia gladioli]|uniref:hypothetical protein n=1 Tax=Burkholderia gladioli TaxID=28095 RepID=UPI00164206B5|nr:hypothetical protein [Burkholderia gladioli]